MLKIQGDYIFDTRCKSEIKCNRRNLIDHGFEIDNLLFGITKNYIIKNSKQNELYYTIFDVSNKQILKALGIKRNSKGELYIYDSTKSDSIFKDLQDEFTSQNDIMKDFEEYPIIYSGKTYTKKKYNI